MQIITLDDSAFSALLKTWKNGKRVGQYWKNGKLQVVSITDSGILVSNQESDPSKLALKATKTFQEAESLALRILFREEQRGSRVEREKEYR